MINSNAEVLRLYYLQSMGVSSYFPRFVLPGALPSVACELPACELPAQASVAASASAVPLTAVQVPMPLAGNKPDTSQPETALESLSRTQALSALQEGSADSGSKLNKRMAETEPGVAHRNTADSDNLSEAVQLQLLLLHVDADIAVLSQIPVLAQAQLQQGQQALLQNILRWLGRAPDTALPARRFQWPLPGIAMTNTRQDAGVGVLRFLEQAFVEHAFRYLLVLGEQAAVCLDADAEHAAISRPWRMLATYSLDELLAMPQLKREAWQTLLPLHTALKS